MATMLTQIMFVRSVINLVLNVLLEHQMTVLPAILKIGYTLAQIV